MRHDGAGGGACGFALRGCASSAGGSVRVREAIGDLYSGGGGRSAARRVSRASVRTEGKGGREGRKEAGGAR